MIISLIDEKKALGLRYHELYNMTLNIDSAEEGIAKAKYTISKASKKLSEFKICPTCNQEVESWV